MVVSYLAAAEADSDDAQIMPVWQELWLYCGRGCHVCSSGFISNKLGVGRDVYCSLFDVVIL